jgi:CreA protein
MKLGRVALAFSLSLLAGCSGGKTEVGEFKNDWLGNEIKIKSLTDPKVDGVICHLSYFDRGVWDRLGKGNWFENPSNSSISCLQTGPITIRNIDLDRSGEEVFDQNQSLVFKQLAVRRIHDAGSDSLIYVSFSRKPVNGSAKMSLSTVPLYDRDVIWEHGKPTP